MAERREPNSAKVAGIRRALQDARPDIAADRAAESFERDAIPVPASLTPDESTPPWKVQVLRDAAEIYRTVVMAGDEGVKLSALRGGKRQQDAVKALRSSGEIAESRERIPDSLGRARSQVVLRGRSA